MKESEKQHEITKKISEQVVDLLIDWELADIPKEVVAHVMLSCAVNMAHKASSSEEEAKEIMLDYIASYTSDNSNKSIH